ncbi:methyltransferase [Streptomyces huiliensis]|uniref:methyltransferase n=1 Tax=Streptomyces huiliensis TaxID=2876027 RepID=UPI001CBB0F3F|nr:methyltransferase [Streptomyces huiliensis]MBZ4318391.1 methyltransferase [Streptomyces huiliensis]
MATEQDRTNDGRTGPPPQAVLMPLLWGHPVAHLLRTMLRLGVADRFGDGEATAEEMAAHCGTLPEPTRRMLRALVPLGLVAEVRPDAFRLTPAGALLRADHPESMAATIRVFTTPAMVRAWEHLEDGLRTDGPVFDALLGHDYFTHIRKDPELSAAFNTAMSQTTRATAEVLPGHYAFGRFGTLVDVGGGDGTLLAAVLAAHPGLRGILYDSAAGLAEAAPRLERAGVADRCALETGDFFVSAPAGGDAYLLKSVLHDWTDERCGVILDGIRRVVPDDGRLLIVEPVLPAPGSAPAGGDPGPYLSDLTMMLALGGRERTAEDFAALCAASGFRLTSVTTLPAPSTFSLVEAVPV